MLKFVFDLFGSCTWVASRNVAKVVVKVAVVVNVVVAVFVTVDIAGDKNSYKQITMPPPMAIAIVIVVWASSM